MKTELGCTPKKREILKYRKDDGALGFIDLIKFNEAMLEKQT